MSPVNVGGGTILACRRGRSTWWRDKCGRKWISALSVPANEVVLADHLRRLLTAAHQYAKSPTKAQLDAVNAHWKNTALTLRAFEELVKLVPSDPELLELGKGIARVPFPSYNSFVQLVLMLRRLHGRLSEPGFSTALDQRRQVKEYVDFMGYLTKD